MRVDVEAKPDDCMRLVGWNVAGGFEKKYHLLEHLDPDVAVLAEACDEARLLRAGVDSFSSAAWIGRRAHKGLLVLVVGDYSVKMLSKAWDQRLEWVLPVAVSGPAEFTLRGLEPEQQRRA